MEILDFILGLKFFSHIPMHIGPRNPWAFLSAATSIPYRYPCGINRIHHWCSVGTRKPQPEGPTFQWCLSLKQWNWGLVLSCQYLKLVIGSFAHSHQENSDLFSGSSSLVFRGSAGEMAKKKKKNQQNQLIVCDHNVPFISFKTMHTHTWSFLFTNKEVRNAWKFVSPFHTQTLQT